MPAPDYSDRSQPRQAAEAIATKPGYSRYEEGRSGDHVAQSWGRAGQSGVYRVEGFYWLVPRVLAGSSRPGGRSGADGLNQDLDWLQLQGIGAILTLTEEAPDLGVLDRYGFESLHLPVVDFTPPRPDQLTAALAFIDRQAARNCPVLVHCYAGQGRTGTVLAAYLVRSGHSPERAIAELRTVCPRAVENDRQLAALDAFAARRDWVI